MVDRGLQTRLDQICRRQRVLSLVDATISGILTACLGYALLRIMVLFVPLPGYAVWWSCALVGLFTLGMRWDRTQTRLGAAFLVDTTLGLRERVTAAVEFGTLGGGSSVLVDRLQQDAARFAPAIDPRRLVPYRLPRKTWLVPPFLLLALLLSTPLPAEWLVRQSTLSPLTMQAIDQQVGELQSLADLLLERALQQDRFDLASLSAALRELAERLGRGELSLEEVESALARIEDQMNAALDTHAPSDSSATSSEAMPPDRALSEALRDAGATPPDRQEDGAQAAGEPGFDDARPDSETEPSQGEPERENAESESDSLEGWESADGEHSSNGLQSDSSDLNSDEAPGSGSSQDASGTDHEPQPGDGDAGHSNAPTQQGDPSDRLDTDGNTEALTGALDPSQATAQRLDTLAQPQADTQPSTSAPGEFNAAPGAEASVVREEVPPQFRDVVRRYFEQLAAEE